MKPDGSHERDAERGKLAEEVLANPIYAEAYETIENEVIRQWREARNPQDREQLHQFLLMLGRVQDAMKAVVRSGEVARAEIGRKLSRAEQIGAVYHSRWDG